MTGAFIFIILQVIFLVDFAHNWAESWLVNNAIASISLMYFIYYRLDKQKETDNNLWYVALLIPTIIFYLLALIGIILMFVFFVKVRYALIINMICYIGLL